MPVSFDLYITTNTHDKKIYLENYNDANKSEVSFIPNKRRDVTPCLIQLKVILMKYKYLWQIHTKKA